MGQPDALDRLAQILILFAALFSLANAAFMVWDPNGWYQLIQTIHTTGPSNQHFIRGVGLAY